MEQHYARIVTTADGSGPTRTMGTQVMVGGVALKGVTRIELVAEVNDVWRARIECAAEPTDLGALAEVHWPTLWQRLVRWWRSFPPARDGGPA